MENQIQLIHAKLIDLHAMFLAFEDVFLTYVQGKDGEAKADLVEKQIYIQQLRHLKNLVLELHETMNVDPVLAQLLFSRQNELAAGF